MDTAPLIQNNQVGIFSGSNSFVFVREGDIKNNDKAINIESSGMVALLGDVNVSGNKSGAVSIEPYGKLTLGLNARIKDNGGMAIECAENAILERMAPEELQKFSEVVVGEVSANCQ